MNRTITRRDALRGLLALGLVAPTAALFPAAQQAAAAQLWPPIWFWDSPRTALKRDAIALYVFNQSGNLGLDSSRNANHLTNNNSVATSTPGKPGAQAAAFVSASSQSLSRATTASLDMGNIDQAWAVWVYPTSSSSARGIVAKEGDSTALDYMISFNLVAASQFSWTVFVGGAAQTATLGTNAALNAWHLVVCWYEAAPRLLRIQVDNSAITQSALGGNLDAPTAAPFTLGNRNRGSGSLYFDGSIGFVLGLKRLFTAAERAWLWNGGQGQNFG